MIRHLVAADDNNKTERSFFWNIDHVGRGEVTLNRDGSLVFVGKNHELIISNIGTDSEQIVIKKTVSESV